jgi:hypothetical protein
VCFVSLIDVNFNAEPVKYTLPLPLVYFQEPSTSKVKVFEAPAQNILQEEIKNHSNFLLKLNEVKDAGLANIEIMSQIEEAKKTLKTKKQHLNRRISDAVRQRKRRKEKKELIHELSKESQGSANKLKRVMNERKGRPPLEDCYPDLHKAIVAIVSAGAGADSRRRTDVLNACLTIDDLRDALSKDGYELSRQALYLRVIPKRKDSADGKKHVRTVPVKIRRAKNNLRRKHVDADFTFATKEYLKNIASMFGPDSVFVLSVDDKAKVPLGITAATKQAPMIMHMTYEVRLPDHDFVVAPSHKLTPSVYAACEIKKSSSKSDYHISYSGPMHIAIRSGKHDSSTAYSHGRDFDQLMTLEEFSGIAKKDGHVKPIVIAFVDGGPDENPRFPKTMDVAIDHFR